MIWRLVPALVLGICALSAEELKPIETVAAPRLPWTVAGERGALFGRGDGSFEAWTWPIKLLSKFQIAAELQDYSVPIDVNALAATISVAPDETVITYSHADFTIRQHAFAPRGEMSTTGAVVVFEVTSARPISLTFSFTPEMAPMWPAPQTGRPDAEWVKAGYYLLHTGNPKLTGIFAMPGAGPGILAPYQERPHNYPLQFRIPHAQGTIPLLMLISDGSDADAQVEQAKSSIQNWRDHTRSYYEHLLAQRTSIETPDHELDESLRWAELAIDQAQVKRGDETGLVAGYYESADSARPGYAWFFGRDTLWTTYAINSEGDFALTRRALDFLIHRQRQDGKMMHEFSQSAESVDWKSTPYFYASADATPLFVMAMWDYVRSSGDVAYLRANWDAVRKSYNFTRTHDSDGDGIYDNTEGTGWVESWPPGMPHQEIYLAAIDQQSSDAMAQLAGLMKDSALQQSAQAAAQKIERTIEAEYDKAGFYAFSRNADATLDTTATIFPSVAWWQGTYSLQNAGRMLTRWASSEFSTDWGTRDISDQTSFYDPISYHQGSVWPLFTGWVSLAEYRAGRPLSGYAHLQQNARLTWLQDLGSATELLSGQFYEPLGRSSSHQLWSSAMIVTPLLRGLFGLQADALQHVLTVNPHLPATWQRAHVRRFRLGERTFDLDFERNGKNLEVTATGDVPSVFCFDQPCEGAPVKTHSKRIPLPGVEISVVAEAPHEGDTTHAPKVTNEEYSEHRALFQIAGPAGTEAEIFVRKNYTGKTELRRVQFPTGTGYSTASLEFTW